MTVRNQTFALAARCLVILLGAALVARLALFSVYRVSGASMLDALLDGDRILVAEVDVLMKPLRHGDTVILEVEDEVLVKRVIAVPGDRIAMSGGTVWRNGSRVPEDIPDERAGWTSFPEYHMKDSEYFVMGDNRRVSVDSRDFGPVQESQVLGKVVLRMGEQGFQTVSALERTPR